MRGGLQYQVQIQPATAQELRDLLAEASAAKQSIELFRR